jgi:ketosteroid isomerase-like protein
MNSKLNAENTKRWMKRFVGVVLLLALGLATAGTAAAQKKKKNTDDSQPTPPPSVIASAPDDQKIDFVIGEMLGAWQIGDIEKLHKNMADDVSVVAGTWTPPAVGWTSYLAAYQAQRARMEQVRMDRNNTLIRVAPSRIFAWACYQWEFNAVVDGSPMAAEGQTTLILEKKADNWVIVHNHTSLVQASQPVAPASATPQHTEPAPAKP